MHWTEDQEVLNGIVLERNEVVPPGQGLLILCLALRGLVVEDVVMSWLLELASNEVL